MDIASQTHRLSNTNMALSWLWLVALFFMSLLFPSVLATIEYSSSNQDLLSPEELPLIKRGQSLQCTYGEDPCGYGCCDGSVRCFYFQYQLASCCVTDVQCPAFMNPCYGNACAVGYSYCAIDGATNKARCYPIIPVNAPSNTPAAYVPASSTPTTTPSNPNAPSSDEGSSNHESHGSSAQLKAKKTKKLPPKTIGGIVSSVVVFLAALAAGIWRFLRKKRRSGVSESRAPGNPSEEYHGPPEYFKQPEVHVSPVSEPSPGFSPPR